MHPPGGVVLTGKAPHSKCGGRKPLGVRVPPPPLQHHHHDTGPAPSTERTPAPFFAPRRRDVRIDQVAPGGRAHEHLAHPRCNRSVNRGHEHGRRGTGQITVAFTIPAGSLDFWIERLAAACLDFDGPTTRSGETVVSLLDPDGMGGCRNRRCATGHCRSR